MRPRVFIHLEVIETETELDYSSCYYEGDIPSISMTNVTTSQVTLKDVIKSLTAKELEELGLKKLSK